MLPRKRYAGLKDLNPFLEAGQVTPVIDRIDSLAEVLDAMGHLEAGNARGKIAIAI